MKACKRTIVILSLGLLVPMASAQSPGQPPGLPPGFSSPFGQSQYSDSRAQVQTSVKAAYVKVPQGSDLPVAIIFDMNPGWHIWTQEGGTPEGVDVFDGAINTEIVIEIPNDGSLIAHEGFMQWPESHVTPIAGLGDFAAFEGLSIAYLPVIIPTDAPLGETTLTFKLTFQTCNETVCLAPTSDHEISLSIEIVAAGQPSTDSDSYDVFADFPTDAFGKIRSGEKTPELVKFDLFGYQFQIDAALPIGFILILLVAAIGGFILNLTPCVLPIIPLKIMGLSQSAGNRTKTFLLGIAMSLGVVAFWMGLGTAIALLAGFTSTNQLFQYPAFTITVGVIIALMSIGMCGLFSIRLPQFVYAINPGHDTYHGSFAFGIMTAVLSTPCTAPFMGAAAAWSATQTPSTVLCVFGSIGSGMALPYLILSAFPKLIERMPRTGPASELIKHVMGLLMLAAAAFFIGVGISGAMVDPPNPPSRLYWWFVGAFGVAAGGWLTYRTIQISAKTLNRAVFGSIGAVMLAISAFGSVMLIDKGPIDWVYYTADRFDTAKSDGHVVLMEFTAEWCLNCKALEKSVLRNPRVVEALATNDVIPIKVDLTGNNEDGNAMLGEVKRLTIPLLVIFAPDGREVFKGDFYTVNQVVEAIRNARGDTAIASRAP